MHNWPDNDPRFKRYSIIFIISISALRLIYKSGLDLIPDEAYYYVWSLHPSLSYFDHPPALAWVMTVMGSFIHSPEWVVNLSGFIFALFTSTFVWRLAAYVYNPKVAFWSLVILHFTLLFAAGSLLTTIDTPKLAFIAAAGFFSVRALDHNKQSDWVWTGLFFGLSLLAKYSAILFIAPLIIILFGRSEKRKFLYGPGPYVAAVLAGFVFLPVILWNAQNEWISFGFQWQHGLGGSKFPTLQYMDDYLGGQLGLAGPILLGIIVFATVAVIRQWPDKKDKEIFLALQSAVPLIFFALTALQKRVEPNWPAMAYLFAVPLAVGFTADRFTQQRSWRRSWSIHALVSATLILLLYIHTYFPLAQLRNDRTAELRQWSAIVEQVKAIRTAYPQARLAANHYQIASQLIVYGEEEVSCLNIAHRRNQFHYWQDQQQWLGDTFLLVDKEKRLYQDVREAFANIKVVAEIPFADSNIMGEERFLIYLAEGYKGHPK
jgi:4-amino-4-deoxy-L-arabinose transferase-like glycosyltransferase